ncbi:MAG: hypothetical protein ACI4RJ_04395 [Alphaproteobacteria bacterium]
MNLKLIKDYLSLLFGTNEGRINSPSWVSPDALLPSVGVPARFPNESILSDFCSFPGVIKQSIHSSKW